MMERPHNLFPTLHVTIYLKIFPAFRVIDGGRLKCTTFASSACDKKGRWALEEDVEGMAINFMRDVAPGASEKRPERLIFQNLRIPFDN